MSYKSLMMILMSLVIAFVIVVGGFVVVYKFFPGLIGIDKQSKQGKRNLALKSKARSKVPNLIISKTDFDDMQKSIVRSNLLKIENAQLTNEKKKLLDSLTGKNELLNTGKTSYPNMLDSISKINRNYAKLRDSLQKITLSYKQVLSDRERVSKMSEEKEKLLIGQLDSLKNKNLSEFAKIYDNSEPKEVAKILEKIDSKDASKILKLMSKKKAGKVLEVISTERAAEIMRQGSQR